MCSPVHSPKADHRKRSTARSLSSELGTVKEEEEYRAQLLMEPPPGEKTNSEQIGSTSENPMERILSNPCPREVMRAKIRYHYMNPVQKFRARRRKPWKLVLQIVKIVLVTLQIFLFGFDRFSLVTFMENNQLALKHLFLKDYQNGQEGVVVFTRTQLYNYLHYAHEQYCQIRTVPLGTYDYDYDDMVNRSEPPPMKLHYKYYATRGIGNNTYMFDPVVDRECEVMKCPFDHEHMVIKNNSFNLGRLREIQLMFSLKTVNLKKVKAWDRPACYKLNVVIFFDNIKHDGRMPVQLLMNNTWLHCRKGIIKGSDPFETRLIKEALVVFDAVVIFICTLSLFLCGRSVYRSLKLAKEAARFFMGDATLEDFTFWDYREFVSLWFFVIMMSDSLTIIGSIYKMAIDQKDSDFYNVSSLFLGMAVLLVWIGLLRFLSYSRKYNILLVTLKAATPSMMRFFVCASLLFTGFMFCGWVVLGPFHPKFKTLTITAECLYSMINGDDLYNTYALLSARAPVLIRIFNQVYLYIFISLFIYVVLSLFIGIISDTYERIKDLGHLPKTKIEKFLNEAANLGREVQQRDPPQPSLVSSEAYSVSQTRGIRDKPNRRNHPSDTQDAVMKLLSVESTGAD